MTRPDDKLELNFTDGTWLNQPVSMNLGLNPQGRATRLAVEAVAGSDS